MIAALRAAAGVPDAQGILLGNGSDELIEIITCALARPGAVMLAPEPTFVMYRMNALYSTMRFVGVPLAANFELDVAAMEAAIERERPALIFLASPNNPTGNRFATADVLRILRAAPGLVVVDEAYTAFAGESFLPRIAEFPNLLVLRTVSKIGMAALRLGYAVAAPEWIAELNKVRQPYNLNALTQAAAQVLLSERALLDEQVAAIVTERARLAAGAGGGSRGERLSLGCELRAGAGSRCAAVVRSAPRGGHPRQEPARRASAAGALPSSHGRHAGRKRCAARRRWRHP